MGEFPEVRTQLAAHLRRDAIRHREGRFREIGSEFLELDEHIYRALSPGHTILVAHAFWDGWVDERNHGWAGFYPGMTKDDWPRIADDIASALEQGVEAQDPVLIKHFGPR